MVVGPEGRPRRRPVWVLWKDGQLAAVEGEGARGAVHARDDAGQERPGLVDDPRVVGAGPGARLAVLHDALDGVDHLARQPADALARRLERQLARAAARGARAARVGRRRRVVRRAGALRLQHSWGSHAVVDPVDHAGGAVAAVGAVRPGCDGELARGAVDERVWLR